MDSEKKCIGITMVSHDDDAIRQVEVVRHPNGNTAFFLRSTFPDQSEPVVFQMLLSPRAVEIMHAALDIGLRDVADWPGKKAQAAAPAPEGGEHEALVATLEQEKGRVAAERDQMKRLVGEMHSAAVGRPLTKYWNTMLNAVLAELRTAASEPEGGNRG